MAGLRFTPPFPVVVVPVVVAAAAVVVLAGTRVVEARWPAFLGVAVLLLAATVAEWFPVPIVGVKAGMTSLATIAIVATGVLYGWPFGVLVGLLTMVLVELRRRKPLVQVAYNSGLYALGGAAAGAASAAIPSAAAMGLAGSAGFYLLNIGLLAAVIADVNEVPYLVVLRGFLRSTFTPFAVMAATTGVLVELWSVSPYLPLLLVPPLVAIAGYQRSLHAAMERQRELDRLKEEFIAVVSHELRTPLAAVYGGVETLQRRSLPEETRERLFGMVRQESARLARLVDDVLWASRLDAGREAGSPTQFEAGSLVGEAAAAAAETAPPHISVITAVDEGLPRVVGSRENAQRVLANLLENAIKYSPEGGVVGVSVSAVGRSIRFSVQDEGIGIPESAYGSVFEKFIRLDPQMTRGIGGTGLGLYISKQLVEQMGGRIWIEPNKDKGSIFSFELPEANAASQSGAD